MKEFIIAAIIIGIAYAIILIRNRCETLDASNSMRPTPPVPAVTPTITHSGIAIGVGTYYDVESPDYTVSVVSVTDGIVKFCYFDEVICTLPVEQFVVDFKLRKQTSLMHD